MLRALSFYVAEKECGQKFSHFIDEEGSVTVVNNTTEFAKVAVMAPNARHVTSEQHAAILNLAEIATVGNTDVALTFGKGLSPFIGP